MKNIETFFELANYDSKNITNKGNKTISQEALNKIETEGVTLEFLQGLNVPVYKYRTQITIHGLFPELQHNYLGGYKNLFQNKNLSIGVKWQAVDYKKKESIYRAITGYLPGWRKQHNSADFFIYKTSDIFRDKETYKTLLEAAKTDISHIDKTLFFGNSGVYLSQTLWGGYYLVTYINIGAILETNIIPCIENITKATMAEIGAKEAARQAKYEADRKQREAEYKAEMEVKKAKQAPLMEAARQILTDAGYTMQEKTPLEVGKIYVKIETDTETGRFNFVAYKYSKEARQKKWRYEKTTSTDLNFEFKEKSWYDNGQQTAYDYASGWVKQVAPAPQPETKQPVKPIAAPAAKGTVTLVNYSDKAIALFGDTKAIKEKIKAIGGRFNPFLNNGGQRVTTSQEPS
jgi:hypothetical protein